MPPSHKKSGPSPIRQYGHFCPCIHELRQSLNPQERSSDTAVALTTYFVTTTFVLSAVTVGEIQAGIEITRERDSAKAEELEAWLDRGLASYGVLPIDAPAFRTWARLMHRRSDTITEDAMNAAEAIVRRLTVGARKVRDFDPFGVELHNPFTAETR